METRSDADGEVLGALTKAPVAATCHDALYTLRRRNAVLDALTKASVGRTGSDDARCIDADREVLGALTKAFVGRTGSDAASGRTGGDPHAVTFGGS